MTWIDVNEMAGKLGMHPRTIQRWCRERKIPHVRIGRDIRFSERQVREIEDAYSVEPEETLDVNAPNPSYRQRAVVVPMHRPPAA